MKIYTMSDMHGCLPAFEKALALVDLSGDNQLILLGDYIHGPDSCGVLKKAMELQARYGAEKVVALLGNHEEAVLDGRSSINENGVECEPAEKGKLMRWMKSLPRFYATSHQIFCHAGVDEEAEDMWQWGTADHVFTEKVPAQTGHFYMDIIAGHVGTAAISGDPTFHDIFYDGQSHYYIDGSVLESGVIPVMMIDTFEEKYYQVTEAGLFPILPYKKGGRLF